MSEATSSGARGSAGGWVPAGEDRLGEQHHLGPSRVDFKVTAQDSSALFIVEITVSGRGGPEQHLHVGQEEWFYLLEGEFIFRVGPEQTTHHAGETVLVPRRVPHGWAATGAAGGKFLAVFTPAGPMEAFFRDAAQTRALPGPNPEYWRTYGMEWAGPPLLQA